jgi:ribosome maturation factor RimP
MKLTKNETIQKVEELLKPVLDEEDAELFDIEYTGRQKRTLLRILVDKKGGKPITIDQCAKISKKLSLLLDINNVIHHKYYLEVSSPGIERPLRIPGHFLRYKGEEAKVKTYQKIDGEKVHIGEIMGLSDDILILNVADKERKIPIESISKANLYVRDFGL